MTIFSMTGFGRGKSDGKYFLLTCEIKTVNHRFKDIRFRLPPLFSNFEFELRKQLEEEFSRGSFDVVFDYQDNSLLNKSAHISIDNQKVASLIQQIQKIAGQYQVPLTLNPTDFLRPEFMGNNVIEGDELRQSVREAFFMAIQELKKSRAGEGEKLKKAIATHLKEVSHNCQIVMGLAQIYQQELEQKLTKKLKEWSNKITIDQGRLGQELIYYLEKLDISEELNRIEAHLQKIFSLFEQKQEIGRQMDFLVQELNREVNTIGAKSSHSEISNAVVQMKVQLEKIREQALNLE